MPASIRENRQERASDGVPHRQVPANSRNGCHYGPVNWPALARAVVARRIELGHETRQAFAEASKISLRTLTDIEAGERGSYSVNTLGRLEHALQWPTGHIDDILHASDEDPFAILGGLLRDVDGVPTVPPSTDYPEGSRERVVLETVERHRPAADGTYVPRPLAHQLGWIAVRPPGADPTADLMARVARHIHRDDFVLAWLLAHADLSERVLWDLELYVRRRREQQNVELLRDLEGRIREAGGTVSYPWDTEAPGR